MAAADAGKMVWCEKPLATSLAEAERMVQTVGDRPNLVWFNYRRVPAIAFAKRLIDEGRLGEIFHYRASYMNQSGVDPKANTWRFHRSEAGSGASGDLLSHLIDLAMYLNGPITELNATQHSFVPGRDVDDATMFMSRFANGSLGSFEASRFGVGCRNRNAFEIHGSKGKLAWNLEELNHLEFYDATDAPNLQGSRKILITGPDHPYTGNFWRAGHIIGYEHTFISTVGDFLASLAKSEEFHANFRDGLAVQQVLDAAERSAQSRSWMAIETPD